MCRRAPAASEPAEHGNSGSLPGIETVLVGFDERPASRDALILAGALSAHSEARLIVVVVRAYWPELIGDDEYERVVAEDEAWVRRVVVRALGERPFTALVLGGGREGEGLAATAVAERADVIVLGSTHRGRLGTVLPGSVGERLLNEAPCAVAVAPVGLAETGMRLHRIAVGYDGSAEAGAALRLATSLAVGAGASLRIIAAVEVDAATIGLQPARRAELEEERLRGRLREAEDEVPASVPTGTQILHGAPQRVLLEAAEGADLLVLGSRGHYGPLRRLLIGSVATAVIRGAPCATLITPGGSR